jgi:hypothetical protein
MKSQARQLLNEDIFQQNDKQWICKGILRGLISAVDDSNSNLVELLKRPDAKVDDGDTAP